MSLPAIRLYPDPCLRKMAQEITSFDQNLMDLVEILEKVMRKQPHGIGIAAPQIGISKQLALVDVSTRVAGSNRLILINPEIIDRDKELLSREGCMSLPEYTGYLKRYETIKLRWVDQNGDVQQKVSSGIEAICIQHELDHLQGQLFIDRIASLKSHLIPRKRSR